jgi:zinc and cadmium transporter
LGRNPIDTTLVWILAATLAGGALSLFAAAAVALTVLTRWVPTLVSVAVGAMLAAAFLDLLPEAFRRSADASGLFATVLIGIVSLFVLEKLALWRHHHIHGASASDPRARAALLILVGDGVHNFVDGVLIAAAFLTDTTLGVITTLAVIAHEIPQEIGDFMVLLNAGYGRTRALLLNLLASLTAVAGGLVGYLLLDTATAALPYVLALAAASFIYVAVADLIPDLHRQDTSTPAAAQVAMLVVGVAIVSAGQILLH